MQKDNRGYWLLGLFVMSWGSLYTQSKQMHRFKALGTEIRLTVYTDSHIYHDYFLQAELLVDSLNLIFSDYDPASEVRRLNPSHNDHCFEISHDLSEVLQTAFDIWKESGGYFDISLSALSRLWRQARKDNQWPKRKKVRKAKARSGMQFLELRDSVLCFDKPFIKLDFGGIAKGYIGDQLLFLAQEYGLNQTLVDLGGDIVCGDPPPNKTKWEIGIDGLDSTFYLSNQAICTSGDRFQFIEYRGKRYSHIIDPFSGYPIAESKEVTVVAASGVLADAWASACTLLPSSATSRLAQENALEIYVLKD